MFGGVYYSNNSSKNEPNVSYNDEAQYPEDIRPTSSDKSEETEEINPGETIEDTEGDTEEEELTPDEDFVDFEIEDEPEEEPEEPEVIEEPEEVVEEVLEEPETSDINGTEIEIINSKVNIRKEPDNTSKIITAVPIGSKGILLEEGRHWSLVQFGDVKGYLSNKYWQAI